MRGAELRAFVRNSRLPIALLLLFWLAPAHAAPITIEFSGVVTQVPIDDLFGDIAPGSLFTGSYTFDSSSPDLIPADSQTSSYSSSGVPYAMTITLAGHTFAAADSVAIGIFDGFIDQYTVLSLGSGGNLVLEIMLQDNTALALADDALPAFPPPLASFTFAEFHLHQVGDSGELQVDGQLTSLTSVPDPNSFGLMCAAAACVWLQVCAMRFRRSRSHCESASRR